MKSALPHFDPNGPHGFTTAKINGRLQHLPTYDIDVVIGVRFEYFMTLEYTRKNIYRATDTGEYFATARGSRRLLRIFGSNRAV